ncbi:MAG: methyltransferase domain-containing protein [Pseudomonadales bacterium]
MSGNQQNSQRAILQQIRQWFESPLGQQVMKGQRAVLDQLLPGFFGYHFLQLSIQQSPLFGASSIQQKMTMGLSLDDESPFVGRATELPFENDSMDVVLLHHLLDFYDSPHDMLREIARVSIPMGHLVIVGFNPVSLWGLFKPFGKLQGNAPWIGHFVRPGRLMDWLNLLNFKIDRVHYTTYGLPTNRGNLLPRVPDYSRGLSRKSNLPFGAVYVIVARKQVGAIRPIRPTWNPKRAFGQLSVVRPAGGSVPHSGVSRTTSPASPDTPPETTR